MKKMNMRIFRGLLLLAVLIGFPGCKTADIVDDGTVYFLMAEITPVHNDSYILPLTDPADIAQADAILAGHAPFKIVVASIARGSSGDGNYRNMNLTGPRKFSWSWHVTSFLAFADITLFNMNGSPTYVENNLESWFAKDNTNIGFSNHRIQRRVAPKEMQ